MVKKHNKTEVMEMFSKSFEEFNQFAHEVSQKIQMKLSGMDEMKWRNYCEQVEKTFEKVAERIGAAQTEFIKSTQTDEDGKKVDHKKAFEHMKKVIKGCLLMCKVALVDIAESLGINRMLRKIGVVSKTPDQIMKSLQKQAEKIHPEGVAAELKEMASQAKTASKAFVGEAKKMAGKAKDKLGKLAKKAKNELTR